MHHDGQPQGVTRQRGFSLIELMLAVSISTVIIAALYAVFNQTQRALRSNVNQVDVLESGRAAMDLLTRELALVAATHRPFTTNLFIFRPPANLSQAALNQPVVQPLPQSAGARMDFSRTNTLWEVFFVAKENEIYQGTGFRVLGAINGVGTLGRFSTNVPSARLSYTNLIRAVLEQPPASYSRIADGVIHFRVQAFDSRGYPMNWYDVAPANATNTYVNVRLDRERNLIAESRASFVNDALPAYLEVELGILEPDVLDQYRSFPANSDFARTFLASHVGQVHLFRQRVPVRLGVIYPSLLRP